MTQQRQHRIGPASGLPVQVLYRKRRFCSALLRALSAQGMSLTLRNLTLPAGTQVELELETPVLDRRLEAVVVRSSGPEVSVLFREPQPELARDLARHAVLGELRREILAVGPAASPPQRPQLARH